MAIKGFMESSLASSEVFQGINDNTKGVKVTDKALNLIKTAKHLTNEDIETAYISVRQISDSLTREAMKAFDEERTVLIYNNVASLSVTQTLPFITYNTPKGYSSSHTTFVFVDKYVTMSRDGVLNMQAPILRDLLTGAVIANGIKRNYNMLSTNQFLQKILTEIYTKFFTRVINREYSIGADKIVFDTIQYWINRFFLENIFETADTPENIEHIATAHFRYIDEMKAAEIKKRYEEVSPSKISELLSLLSEASPRMRNINLGRFISNWVNYYYIPSMLAIDNIEYLIFMIMTMLSGNNIINTSASDIVKETKGIKDLRGELLKLI